MQGKEVVRGNDKGWRLEEVESIQKRGIVHGNASTHDAKR